MKTENTNLPEQCPCFKEKHEDKKVIEEGIVNCARGVIWFLLIPLLFVILAFTLGYSLDASAVRILWLIITGALTVTGIVFYILMTIWATTTMKSSNQ